MGSPELGGQELGVGAVNTFRTKLGIVNASGVLEEPVGMLD